MSLTDPHGRTIDYLRVSITDRCDLNCIYCRPAKTPFQEERESESGLLTSEEILAFCREAAFLGIRHIRITGGEPLLRNDCFALIAALKSLPGVETVTLTTNGVRLKRALGRLLEAGIDGINVSLDTLNRSRYQAITGYDRLEEVLAGIREAVSLGIPVKLNCVAMSGGWDSIHDISPEEDFLALARLARDLPLDIRFIEAMPIGPSSLPALDYRKLLELFCASYPGMKRLETARGFGPAVYYKIPGFSGCIGFISAIHGNFCNRCNRVRLTSRGVLKSCLGYKGTVHLKPIFRENTSEMEEALRAALLTAVSRKPPAHRFGEEHPLAERETMSIIGG